MAPAPEDPAADVREAAKWVAGGLAVATTALALVGLTDGQVTRLITIHPVAFTLGAAMLVVSAVLGVTGLLAQHRTWRSGLVSAGLLLFLSGTLVLVVFHARATGTQQRPTATMGIVHSDDRYAAAVTVRAEGLHPAEYVFVLVQGQNSQRHLEPNVADFAEDDAPVPRGEYSKQRLYKGRIGPDAAGSVDVSFDIGFDARLYEQLVVQAAIADADFGPEIEPQVEFGQQPQDASGRSFACNSSASRLSCATVLVPEVPEASPSAAGSVEPEG